MLLARLQALEVELRVGGPGGSPLVGEARAQRSAEHARLFDEAERQRWNMIVQREAMGLSNHDDVERVYPRPRRLSG